MEGRGGFDFGMEMGRAVVEAFGEAVFRRLLLEGGDHKEELGREAGDKKGARKTVGELEMRGMPERSGGIMFAAALFL